MNLGEAAARRLFFLRSEIKRNTERQGKRLNEKVALQESAAGTKRTWRDVQLESAMRSKADAILVIRGGRAANPVAV
jgi:hypothetical protein